MPLPKSNAQAVALSFRDQYCAQAGCDLRTRLVYLRDGEAMTQDEFLRMLAVIERLAL